MPQITDLLQSGGSDIWLVLPLAVMLGALHGLEPGHAKTMMAAFIVAVRGTPAQAALLGLAATISHTAIVWLVVLAGLYFGRQWDIETNEPYFQIASAAVIIGIALWMLANAFFAGRRQASAHHHHHHHDATDRHEAYHAAQIRERFSDRDVTTGQLIAFGLTGGLIPCAAAVTVLLLCLQMQKIYLGALVVLAFSVGLALTLIASGLAAAWGVRHAQRRWAGIETVFRRAPYISGSLVLGVGVLMALSASAALH